MFLQVSDFPASGIKIYLSSQRDALNIKKMLLKIVSILNKPAIKADNKPRNLDQFIHLLRLTSE